MSEHFGKPTITNIPPADSETENLVDATENVQQPSNEKVGGIAEEKWKNDLNNDFLTAEQQRRKLFEHIVYSGAMISFFLYLLLAIWIFYSVNSNAGQNAWHMATILALPATTILFLLIKVLSRRMPDNLNEKEPSTPAGEFMDKCVDITKTLLDLIKKK